MSIRYDNYMNRQFTEFKSKVRKHTPSLANRIFALRGKGCSELEHYLGKVLIYSSADYWPKDNQYHSMFIAIEVLVKCLFADLAKAERKVNNEQSKTRTA